MRTFIFVISLTALTGCATTQPAATYHSSEFGKAVRQNIAVQTVAPSAKQKADTFIPADAAKRAKARENYRKGETPNPQPVTTVN